MKVTAVGIDYEGVSDFFLRYPNLNKDSAGSTQVPYTDIPYGNVTIKTKRI